MPDRDGVTALERPFRHIVLTGGPGGGKTTALPYLRAALSRRGWQVFTVAEAATIVLGGGADEFARSGEAHQVVAVQAAVLSVQRSLRTHFTELAHTAGKAKTVIVYDRAELDGAAYVPEAEFDRLLTEAGTDRGTVLDSYDAVIHLVTAADGASNEYSTDGHAARHENARRAVALDAGVRDAWSGHRSHHIVGNGPGGFPAKLTQLVNVVCAVLDDTPIEHERKFLLTDPAPDWSFLDQPPRSVSIEQWYLTDDDTETRVRRSNAGTETNYTHTRKRDAGDADSGAGTLSRYEIETEITEARYHELCSLADPSRRRIRKTRYRFEWAGQTWELDEIHAPFRAWLLELETATATRSALKASESETTGPGGGTVGALPPLGTLVDVTADPRWRGNAIAARTQP